MLGFDPAGIDAEFVPSGRQHVALVVDVGKPGIDAVRPVALARPRGGRRGLLTTVDGQPKTSGSGRRLARGTGIAAG